MSDIGIRPLHDRLVVRQFEAESVTESGIVLTGDAEKPHEGEVLAVGRGKSLPDGTIQPVEVQVGDKVLFGQYVGQEVTYNGEDYLLLSEEEIIAILV